MRRRRTEVNCDPVAVIEPLHAVCSWTFFSPTRTRRPSRGVCSLRCVVRVQAEEDLGRAQKIFEELNVELQDELPVLWDR